MDKKNENVDYYIQKTEGIMLSDVDIKRALDEKLIEVSPLDEAYIQPSSIDLRVGSEFRVFENHKYSHIDPKADQDDLTTLVTATIEEPLLFYILVNLFLGLLMKESRYQIRVVQDWRENSFPRKNWLVKYIPTAGICPFRPLQVI
jgi:Deoxycytidine deaminase